LLSLLAVTAVAGQQKPGKNQTVQDAAKWVESAGDRFVLTLYGPDTTMLVFTTDKDARAAKTSGKFFVISKEEAAATVQALANCGLWSRPDTLPEIHFGRFLAVGRSDERDLRTWRLGEVSDDVSSLVIIQHLLQASKGERQQALKDWLLHGQGKKPK
jgi:hypothetical protein